MTTPLPQVFADAQEKERACWYVQPSDDRSTYRVIGMDQPRQTVADNVQGAFATEAHAERFIAQRCNDAGFRALAHELSRGQTINGDVLAYIRQLISDGGA